MKKYTFDWRTPRPYQFAATALLSLTAALFAASLSAPATFWLARCGVDPFTTAEECAGGLVVAVCLAASAGLRGFVARWMPIVISRLWSIREARWPGKQYEGGELPPATWPTLAAMRMFLALVVLSHHVSRCFSYRTPALDWFTSFDGNVAVIAFLFISGFCMAHSVTKERNGFYCRRFWRVAPVYWSCLVLAIVPYLLGPVGRGTAANPWFHLNAAPWWSWLVDFAGLNGIIPNTVAGCFPAWSLGVEIALYTLAPWFMLCRPRALALLTAGTGWLFIARGSSHFYSSLYYLFPLGYTAGMWLVGMMFYRFVNYAWASVLPFFGYYLLTQYNPFTPTQPNALHLAFGFAVLMVSVRFMPALPRQLTHFCYWLGDLSYPLYMVHAPTAWIIWLTLHTERPAIYLCAIAGATLAVYYGVDLPVKRWRERRESIGATSLASRPASQPDLPLTAPS